MIQLKTDQKYKFGQTNTIPVAGEVKISEEGIIEVETIEQAQEIEACEIGFYILEEVEETTTTTTVTPATTTTTTEDIKPKVEENDLTGSQSVEVDEETKTLLAKEQEEKAELLKSLDAMTLAQLKEFAKPFPFIEWGTLNKAPLIDYLKSKI